LATLILLIAMILQGEAGSVSDLAMYAVADTMLYRHSQYTIKGYTNERAWNLTLRSYYGREEPSEFALEIADRMINSPWDSVFSCAYAYSNSDAYNQGWTDDIDFRFCNPYNDLCVNLSNGVD
jgi:hypothetical protein